MTDDTALTTGRHIAQIDYLVEHFAVALTAKLIAAEQKHGWRGHWQRADWREDLRRKLLEHVEKGDPLDVAAYAAFAWHHGWSLAGGDTQWVCFHCGFRTMDRAEARAHFGDDEETKPLCKHWSEMSKDERLKEIADLYEEIQGLRNELYQAHRDTETAEYLAGNNELDIRSRFKGARSIQEAFNMYDSMEGRALLAEEKVAALEAKLQRLSDQAAVDCL